LTIKKEGNAHNGGLKRDGRKTTHRPSEGRIEGKRWGDLGS